MTATSMSHRDRLLVFGGLLLAGLMSSLDATVLGTALPAIVGDLGGLDRLAWVSTGYVLATTVTVPLSGRLGDLFGRRPILLVGLLGFMTASAACGAASSMTWLIAFRVVQGAAAGCLLSSMFALSGDLFEPRERAKYQGYSALIFAVSGIAGPLIGGLLADHASWRWAFYVNLPLGLVATAAVLLFLRLPKPEGRPRVDYPGIVLLGAAVTCFTLVTSWAGTRHPWHSPVVIGLAAGAAALFTLWVLVERTAAEPVVPPRLFRDRSFAVACVVAAVGGATGFGLATYLPMFFQVVGGVGATESGLLLLPMMTGLLAASMGAGRYIARTGRYHRLPAASMALSGLGVALLATMDADTGLVTAGCFMAVLGFGAGLSQQVVVLIAQNAAPRRDLGAASSGVFATRMLGTAAGMAVFGAIVSSRFAEEVGRRVPDGQVPDFTDAVRPAVLDTLPGPVRDGVAEAFAAAFSDLFLAGLPLLAVGLTTALLLPNVPLPPRGKA
ncbi:EmrB/QacA subfamily drug resistance transporter [Actinomadura pelletieri DSM 43383]|uniref:EmrB/QacA subfamily drug resistance transporter n=1 Tax=Actinomadura pelletieri DSM 43383 TaxID=1120940 RepID=A0A495QL19_9ACTN|nr:MDR family MFS transporter [Actinomadura pelletieri]RKS73285.1 EmrB/QacA subfamily drug resistance transporter [Actinomadura pelletieri DSM 43383]